MVGDIVRWLFGLVFVGGALALIATGMARNHLLESSNLPVVLLAFAIACVPAFLLLTVKAISRARRGETSRGFAVVVIGSIVSVGWIVTAWGVYLGAKWVAGFITGSEIDQTVMGIMAAIIVVGVVLAAMLEAVRGAAG